MIEIYYLMACRALRKARYSLREAKWRVIHWFTKPHMIDLRSPRNGYEGGHLDAVEAILFASFNRFVQFMDREKPLDHFDFTLDDKHKFVASEMLSLYRWWTVERPEREEGPYSLDHDTEDQKNLERLIAIREWLWT